MFLHVPNHYYEQCAVGSIVVLKKIKKIIWLIIHFFK